MDWSDVFPRTTSDENRSSDSTTVRKNIFIAEDLTRFRYKLLHYVKDFNDQQSPKPFDSITTFNGNIKCYKKVQDDSGRFSFKPVSTIASPEDFLKAGITMDESKFEGELMF